jgi:putative BNR repeat neuraminidase
MIKISVNNERKILFIIPFIFLFSIVYCQNSSNTKVSGYKGIWFELNQKYKYGDKYSGALATYTAKHIPLAIYAKEVDKTFFVFGGTTAEDKKYLLCNIGEFNHKTGLVSKPTIVYDKQGVSDPHDNPSIMIDDDGFIWVFVSGRGRNRPGFKYKSNKPFDIDEFSQITEEEMTYPQPWNTDFGLFHFFTKYTGIRQLYFETSRDGMLWTEDKLLAAIPVNEGEKSGHYQISNAFDGKVVATFFNRHPNGIVDKRTDLYYIQSKDFGKIWTTIDGVELHLPIEEQSSPARVVDYASQSKNVYLKDTGFDSDGNPACLYIRSNGHEPGPRSAPYEWCITKWDGRKWHTSVVTTSDHNYDMGSLYILEDEWNIVGPTEKGPQDWGVGGEIALWQSKDKCQTWKKIKTLTENSKLNHSYVRRPVNYKSPFCFFWADGHSHKFSKSHLYFGDFNGNIWQLPYEMTNNFEKPIKLE